MTAEAMKEAKISARRTGKRWWFQGKDVLTPAIVAMALLGLAGVGFAQHSAQSSANEQAAFVPASFSIAQKVAIADVYLLQALGGNEDVDIHTKVFGNLHEAERLVKATLEGGPTGTGEYLTPVEDPEIREDLELLQAQVQSFNALASERLNHRERAGQIGTNTDTHSDKQFEEIVAQTRSLAQDVQRRSAAMRANLQKIDAAVMVMLLALFVGVGFFARKTRRAIVQKNAELEVRVAERTKELAENEARTTAIVNTAVDAIITIDDKGKIRSINPATEEIFGFTSGELIGESVGKIMPSADRQMHDNYVSRYIKSGQPKVLGMGRETTAMRKDGTEFPIDISVSEAKVGESRLFVGLIRDITERKAAEEELQRAKAAAEEAATHDPLTGLWNHNRIIELLIEELARSDRDGSPVSVAMVDLDHFKQVNDTFGHVIGDVVLTEIANRLTNAVRVYDRVGRFGGEEFVVVLPGTSEEAAKEACERIRWEISKDPIQTEAGPMVVTASLGVVSRVGALGNDATALLVAADTALYEAKESGRDRVTVAAAS